MPHTLLRGSPLWARAPISRQEGSVRPQQVPPSRHGSLRCGAHPLRPEGTPQCVYEGGLSTPSVWGLVPPTPPGSVTCSLCCALSPLEVEDGEQRQEPPQEMSGQRCGEPEGDGGRMRAGPRPSAPPPRAAPALPQTSRSRAAMLRLTAAALSENRLRGPSAAIAPLTAAPPPPSWGGTHPPFRALSPPSWEGTRPPASSATLGGGAGGGGIGRPCWGGRVELEKARGDLIAL